MLLIGWRARFAAAMLFLFIISTTLVFHAFWSVDPKVAQEQMIQLLTNLAMMGGMLYIVVHGPGPLSLDQK
jgi:putative oxidoreductase